MAATNDENLFAGLTFFLRPGAKRAEIRTLVEGYGGKMTNKCKYEVIRLTDEKSDKQGVHIDWIYDSVKKKELLNELKYMAPQYGSKNAVTSTHMSIDVTKVHAGRHKYEPEEDDAIMQYIAKHGREYGEFGSITGNMLWKEMELKKVTLHSWQSMKDRYLKHLQQRPPSSVYEPITFVQSGGEVVPFANNDASSRPQGSKTDVKTQPTRRKDVAKLGSKKKLLNSKVDMFADSPRGEAVTKSKIGGTTGANENDTTTWIDVFSSSNEEISNNSQNVNNEHDPDKTQTTSFAAEPFGKTASDIETTTDTILPASNEISIGNNIKTTARSRNIATKNNKKKASNDAEVTSTLSRDITESNKTNILRNFFQSSADQDSLEENNPENNKADLNKSKTDSDKNVRTSSKSRVTRQNNSKEKNLISSDEVTSSGDKDNDRSVLLSPKESPKYGRLQPPRFCSTESKKTTDGTLSASKDLDSFDEILFQQAEVNNELHSSCDLSDDVPNSLDGNISDSVDHVDVYCRCDAQVNQERLNNLYSTIVEIVQLPDHQVWNNIASQINLKNYMLDDD